MSRLRRRHRADGLTLPGGPPFYPGDGASQGPGAAERAVRIRSPIAGVHRYQGGTGKGVPGAVRPTPRRPVARRRGREAQRPER
ncbi:hypothetical protein FTX61_01505 [Nitriliruptoraceae bacterium ZYF776]|nr:hypothetical protein [Profundirhabdus halotolerans]